MIMLQQRQLLYDCIKFIHQNVYDIHEKVYPYINCHTLDECGNGLLQDLQNDGTIFDFNIIDKNDIGQYKLCNITFSDLSFYFSYNLCFDTTTDYFQTIECYKFLLPLNLTKFLNVIEVNQKLFDTNGDGYYYLYDVDLMFFFGVLYRYALMDMDMPYDTLCKLNYLDFIRAGYPTFQYPIWDIDNICQTLDDVCIYTDNICKAISKSYIRH